MRHKWPEVSGVGTGPPFDELTLGKQTGKWPVLDIDGPCRTCECDCHAIDASVGWARRVVATMWWMGRMGGRKDGQVEQAGCQTGWARRRRAGVECRGLGKHVDYGAWALHTCVGACVEPGGVVDRAWWWVRQVGGWERLVGTVGGQSGWQEWRAGVME